MYESATGVRFISLLSLGPSSNLWRLAFPTVIER